MQSYKTRRRIYICFQLVQVTDCSRARFGWAAASLHIQIRSFLGLFSKWASMQMTVGERILLQGFSRMLWNMFFVWHKKKELVPPGVNSLQHPWIQPDNSCHLLSIRKLQMSSSCLDRVSKTDYSSAAKRKCWRVRFCEQLICSRLYEAHAESDVSDGMSRQSSHVCGDRHSMFWDLRVFSAVSVAKLSQNMIFS